MTEVDSSTAEWQQWERRLTKIGAAVEAWQARTNNAPTIPAKSALGGDDTPGLVVSNLAWYSLIVAVEHLDFVIACMRATSTMYPTAYMTTLRSALLSASHAVWVLSPVRRAGRRERAMRLQMQDLDDQLKMLRSVWGLSREQETARESDIANLDGQAEANKAIVDRLGLLPASLAKLNNTDVVTAVAKQIHDDPIAASGVQLLWRTGSAAAHGQRSYATMRMNRNVLLTEGERKVMQLRGDLTHDVGPAAGAVTIAISEAFRLFDLRCGHVQDSERQVRFSDL